MQNYHDYKVLILEPNKSGKGYKTRKTVENDTSPSQAAYHIARREGYVCKQTMQGWIYSYMTEVETPANNIYDGLFAQYPNAKLIISVQSLRGSIKTYIVTG